MSFARSGAPPIREQKLRLRELSEKGFGKGQIAEMQKIIDAEKSDLFDVLAYVAYASPPLTQGRAGDQGETPNQSAFQQQAAGLLRLCAFPLRRSRRR